MDGAGFRGLDGAMGGACEQAAQKSWFNGIWLNIWLNLQSSTMMPLMASQS